MLCVLEVVACRESIRDRRISYREEEKVSSWLDAGVGCLGVVRDGVAVSDRLVKWRCRAVTCASWECRAILCGGLGVAGRDPTHYYVAFYGRPWCVFVIDPTNCKGSEILTQGWNGGFRAGEIDQSSNAKLHWPGNRLGMP